MIRKMCQWLWPLMGLVVVAAAAAGFAQKEKEGAQADSSPSLQSLLAGDYAFTQPDKDRLLYKVTVESGGEVMIVYCEELTGGWKDADGAPVKYVSFYCFATSWNDTKDVKPSIALLAKLAEANNANIFVSYALNTVEKTGEWVILARSNMFLRGATKGVFSDYLALMFNGTTSGKKKFVPFLKPE